MLLGSPGSSINSPHSSWAASTITRNGLYEPAPNEIINNNTHNNNYLSRASWKFLENDPKNLMSQRFWQTHQAAASSTSFYSSSKAQERGAEGAPRHFHGPLHPLQRAQTAPEEGLATLKRKFSSTHEVDLDLSLSLKTRESEKKVKTVDHEEIIDSSLSLSLFSASKEIRDIVGKNSLDLSL